MKQSWLDSLVGMTPEQAEDKVWEAGLETQVYQYDEVASLILQPETVLLWLNKDGKTVYSAVAGNVGEVEVDTETEEDEGGE